MDYILSGKTPPRKLNNNWGATFENRLSDLPVRDSNGNNIQYKEFMIRPLESGYNNNVYRIVVGSNGNYYFSNTHYGQNPQGSLPFYRAGTLPENRVNQIFGK